MYISKYHPNEKKPQLPISLQIQLIQKPLKQKPFYTDVAETLEEIIQALENGQNDGHLNPRENKNKLNAWMNHK